MTNGPGKAHEPIDRLAGRSVFGANAAGYDSARMGYPQALFDRLARNCAIRPRILEIGAGTGLATSGLLTLAPSNIVAVEPDADMAKVLAHKLTGRPVEIVCASFMDAKSDADFDLVACAAAFHWLEPVSAMEKVRSSLAQRGIFAVWWNSYFGHGQPDPFGDRVSEILEQLAIPLPPSYRGRRHYAFDAEYHRSAFATGGFRVIDEVVLKTERELTAQQACELFATFSFVALLPGQEREVLFNQLENLINREFDGLARSVHATALYVAQ